ncbi:MAG: BMP family ABC transporter substrate-binding protein [Alphaproteobacteria bacterium]|nr:BMP family ABC transporter substrate-binding protein [Alphaproteobacteria bacterium]
MKKFMFSALAAAAIAATAIFGAPGTAEAQVKVAFMYVGPVDDFGWTFRHDEGRKAVEARFGDAVETTFVESVSEGPDAERVIRQLAEAGNDIIFTTSFGFMDPTIKVAAEFPDVKFEHATGFKRAPNDATYSARFYEGRPILGTIAGRVTKSNIIGYIGAFPIPEVVRGINAFTIALRRVNPQAEVKVVWLNTWFDPAQESTAAQILIDQGADVILQHTDSPAPVQIASKNGVIAFGQASDQTNFAPDAHATAIIDNWDSYYIERVQAVIDGTWESTDTWLGLGAKMVTMAPYADWLPADVRAEAQALEAAIASGDIHPFAGPIKAQDGTLVVADGAVLDDGVLLGMDYYVEGVQGALPQ